MADLATANFGEFIFHAIGKRLKVAAGLPVAETLRRALLNFRVKINPQTAHDSYEHWREGDHDDLLLAVSMACWFRQWYYRHTDPALARHLRRTGERMAAM